MTISTSGTIVGYWMTSVALSTHNAASKWGSGQAHHDRDRYSKREVRWKQGARINPHGDDAGKQIKGQETVFPSRYRSLMLQASACR